MTQNNHNEIKILCGCGFTNILNDLDSWSYIIIGRMKCKNCSTWIHTNRSDGT